ncbi:peptidoglycan-binding protein [Thalassobacillus devorans]|uniref:peptidoglycan-binding protein n=1 Tax=Thalassobacillus devorans TaxID=279813 RepID=UPI00141BDAAC
MKWIMASDALIEELSETGENNEIRNNPVALHTLTEGMHHDDIKEFKLKLNWLGYGKSKITPKFGPYFKEQVMKFQSDYQLPITGKIDEETKEKIDSVLLQLDSLDHEEDRLQLLANTLERLGFGEALETSSPDKQRIEASIRNFQSYYHLESTGNVNAETFGKMKTLLLSPYQLGEKNENIIKLKQKLNALGYGRLKVTSKFGSLMEKKLKKFQQDYGLPVSGIADEITISKMKLAQQVKERVTYSNYDVSLKDAVKQKQETMQDDVMSRLDPNNFINDSKKKFYFVDLFRSNVAGSISTLNKLLESDDRLKGKGQTIVEAADRWNINELFLLTHALYPIHPETYLGEGDDISDWTRKVKSHYDSSQNTLYKMYCNPEEIQEGNAQDDTDVEWVTKQMENLYQLYQALDTYTLYLEIPVYRDRPVEKYIRG